MKKILISLFALSSVASFAMEKDFNVYTKLGVDVYSNYTKFVDDTGKSLTPKKGKFTYSLFLEATKNVTPNFELGFGVGHIARKNSSHSYSGVDEDDGTKFTLSYKVPRYKSIPLYAIAKYNFDLGSELKPYVKADLGYSFNKINNSSVYANIVTENGDSGREKLTDVKIKNGLYTTIGAGVEYRNFLTELSYSFNKAKVNLTDSDGTSSIKYNNKAIRLSVGYKFNF